MKKIIFKTHLWLSIPLGLFITVICFSGAMLVFEEEITRVLHPKLFRAEAPIGVSPLQPSQLLERVKEQLPYNNLHPTSLRISGRRDEPCIITFAETGHKRFSVDPYTGGVNGRIESSAFFDAMRKLHRWLLNPPASKGEKSIGKIIVGVSTLCLVAIVISGLILWAPHNRKMLAKRLKVSLSGGSRRFWCDCHNVLGFYATLLLLVMALTGLTWSSGRYRSMAYTLFGVNKQEITAQEKTLRKSDNNNSQGREKMDKAKAELNHEKAHSKPETLLFDYSVWDKVLSEITVQYPSFKTIELKKNEARITRQSAIRRTDRVTFDPNNARPGNITKYEDLPRQQRLRSWFYAVHTGSWGGIWTKLLYFLAALIGSTLPLTGYYLWFKRQSASIKRNKKHSRIG